MNRLEGLPKLLKAQRGLNSDITEIGSESNVFDIVSRNESSSTNNGNAASSSSASATTRPTTRPDIRKPEKSQLLDRLKTFLPALKQANDALEDDVRNNGELARERYNIETIDSSAEKVIQMDLHCGILEQKAKRAKPDTIKLPRGIKMDKDQPDDDEEEEVEDDEQEDDLDAEQLELRNQLLIQALSSRIQQQIDDDESDSDSDDDSTDDDDDEDDDDNEDDQR